VLGHSQCGAVTAALTGEELPESVERLIAPILPAVAQVKRDHPDLPAAQLAGLAVEANVWQAMKDLLAQSEIVRVAVSLGRLQLTGAVYDLVSGCVEWLGQHPRQNALLQD
jgi:carbonic anhydrase